jgi:hypothetical protein
VAGVQGRTGLVRTAGQPSGRSAAHRPDVTELHLAPPAAGQFTCQAASGGIGKNCP